MLLFRRDDYFITSLLLAIAFTSSSHSLNATNINLRGLSLSSEHHSFSLSCDTHRASIDKDADLMEYLKVFRLQNQPFQQTTIPVCFHILSDSSGTNALASEQIQDQLDYLNHAYSSASCCDASLDWCQAESSCSVETGFRFAWALLDTTKQSISTPISTVPHHEDEGACIITHNVPKWIRFFGVWDPRLRHMKRKLHKGDSTTLNVYWTNFWSNKLAGYATLPFPY